MVVNNDNVIPKCRSLEWWIISMTFFSAGIAISTGAWQAGNITSAPDTESRNGRQINVLTSGTTLSSWGTMTDVLPTILA